MLGRTASTKYTQIALDGDPGVDAPDDLSGSEPSSTTVAPALVDPGSTITGACAYLQADQRAISVPAGFEPVVEGGEGSFAQVVNLPEIAASVDLGSGEFESSPDAATIGDIGSRSAVVVCAERDNSDSSSALLCTNTAAQASGSPKSYRAIGVWRYRLRAFELESGRMLGEGHVEGEVQTCPDGEQKVDTADVDAEVQRLQAASQLLYFDNVDVTDEQFATWTVAHFQGGTFH